MNNREKLVEEMKAISSIIREEEDTIKEMKSNLAKKIKHLDILHSYQTDIIMKLSVTDKKDATTTN